MANFERVDTLIVINRKASTGQVLDYQYKRRVKVPPHVDYEDRGHVMSPLTSREEIDALKNEAYKNGGGVTIVNNPHLRRVLAERNKISK
jgi:hypothetical protein